MELTLLAATPQLRGILIGFLVIVVVIAVIAGLIWCIENWILKGPIPQMIKLVLAIILLVCIVIWALGAFGISI
jgi:hypothetical protein